MHAIEALGLYRFFHTGDTETAALRGVSMHVDSGEFVAIMGPSGSGKSTLLACLAGLDEPNGGHVNVGAARMSRRDEATRAMLRARHIGILMQTGNLFEHLTVAANIRLQMQLASYGKTEDMNSLLMQTGLSERRDFYPCQLSGGELARAGLAVALSANRKILLADEPTGEVDALTESSLLDLMRARLKSGLALLVVTHSGALAARADRVLAMHDGRLDHV
jgi:putative ABC transport system ATP-binding protein